MRRIAVRLSGIGLTGSMVTLLFICAASPVFAQFFTIDKYHAAISIYADSGLFIKETIEVTFDRPRHGIYRDITFRNRDDLGRVIETPIEVLQVKDGKDNPWKFRVQKQGNVINIRIGDPNTFVSGSQTYAILYRVKNAILFLNDHDELYWNVTGNEWQAPIRSVSANVFLVTKEKAGKLRAIGYEGYYGSREECGYETEDNGGKFYTRRSLRTGEGMTIVMGWDKGLVTPPSWGEKILWTLNLKENWVFLLPIISLFFMVRRWYSQGRDPIVRQSVRVMYEPPRYSDLPLTPAEVGTLVDEKIDPRDLTATIVGLAQKGYIKIEETKKEGFLFDKADYRLKALKEPDDLGPFEAELMRCLFPGAGRAKYTEIMVSDLENRFYTNLTALKGILYGELVKKRYFLRSPEEVRTFYHIVGVASTVVAAILLAGISHGAVKSIAAGILTGLPILAFARLMPAKTRPGASAYLDVLGFQEFLNRAEKDRLERMGDKELFSKFLPYAIALDVSDNWAKAFDGIYQAPPDWYVPSSGYGRFSPRGFSDSIGAVTSSLGSAMTSQPRSSGGGDGGGGFSGGGGGGGGGGSW